MAIQSSKAGQHLVGVVSRITRKALDAIPGTEEVEAAEVIELPENNLVRISLIGTLIAKLGLAENVFRRTLETVPEIDANCFALEGSALRILCRSYRTLQAMGRSLNWEIHTG